MPNGAEERRGDTLGQKVWKVGGMPSDFGREGTTNKCKVREKKVNSSLKQSQALISVEVDL